MTVLRIRTIDFFRGNEIYAPSFEEMEAIEATRQNDTKSAQDWFDRAILSDPSRGPRIYDLCIQMGSPLKPRYVWLAEAATRFDSADYVTAVKRVCKRHPSHSSDETIKKPKAYNGLIVA